MRKKIQKYTAAMMAAIMSLSTAGAVVSAEDAKNIVILGDSISAGTALAEGEQSYAALLEEQTGANVQNFSAAHYTTQDVLTLLDDAQVQAALENADIILVNVGIHDIMDPFMAKANEYMEKWGFEKFEDVFKAQLEDYGLTDNDLIAYNNELNVAAKSNRETAAANMLAIGDKLSVYSDSHIVFQNVYNSINTIENFESLSQKRKTAYKTVYNTITLVLNDSVNASITQLADTYNYDVVDVFTAFEGYAYKYANLATLDVNPTAEGHRVIAEAVIDKTRTLDKGDVNGDGKVDAADAATVLVHATDIGASGNGVLNVRSFPAADVIADDAADALDAARILVYAADLGAEGEASWD